MESRYPQRIKKTESAYVGTGLVIGCQQKPDDLLVGQVNQYELKHMQRPSYGIPDVVSITTTAILPTPLQTVVPGGG